MQLLLLHAALTTVASLSAGRNIVLKVEECDSLWDGCLRFPQSNPFDAWGNLAPVARRTERGMDYRDDY